MPNLDGFLLELSPAAEVTGATETHVFAQSGALLARYNYTIHTAALHLPSHSSLGLLFRRLLNPILLFLVLPVVMQQAVHQGHGAGGSLELLRPPP